MALKQSAGTGNWNVGATWVGGIVPQAGDTFEILDGHIVTVTSEINAVSDGTIRSGGRLVPAYSMSTSTFTNITVDSGGSLYASRSASSLLRVSGVINANGVNAVNYGVEGDPIPITAAAYIRFVCSVDSQTSRGFMSNSANSIKFYGAPRVRQSTLAQTAPIGNTTIVLADDMVLRSGTSTNAYVGVCDFILIGHTPDRSDNGYSGDKNDEIDIYVVSAYDPGTKTVTLGDAGAGTSNWPRGGDATIGYNKIHQTQREVGTPVFLLTFNVGFGGSATNRRPLNGVIVTENGYYPTLVNCHVNWIVYVIQSTTATPPTGIELNSPNYFINFTVFACNTAFYGIIPGANTTVLSSCFIISCSSPWFCSVSLGLRDITRVVAGTHIAIYSYAYVMDSQFAGDCYSCYVGVIAMNSLVTGNFYDCQTAVNGSHSEIVSLITGCFFVMDNTDACILDGIIEHNYYLLYYCFQILIASTAVISDFGDSYIFYKSFGIHVANRTFASSSSTLFLCYFGTYYFKDCIFDLPLSTNGVILVIDEGYFDNCLFNNPVEYLYYNEDNNIESSYTESINHNQISGAVKVWTKGGIVTKVNSPKPSHRPYAYMFAPEEDSTGYGNWYCYLKIDYNIAPYTGIYFKTDIMKTVSMEVLPKIHIVARGEDPLDDVAYLPLASATMTDSINTWETINCYYYNDSSIPCNLILRILTKNSGGYVYAFPEILETQPIQTDQEGFS